MCGEDGDGDIIRDEFVLMRLKHLIKIAFVPQITDIEYFSYEFSLEAIYILHHARNFKYILVYCEINTVNKYL